MQQPVSTQARYLKLSRANRPLTLVGATLVTDPQKVPSISGGEFFYYQFVRKRGATRVMVCEDESERAFITKALKDGARIQFCLPQELSLSNGIAAQMSRAVPKGPCAVLLKGETIKAPEWLRIAFRKGPFTYQVTGKIPSHISTCDSDNVLAELIKHVAGGTPVVIRH